MKTNGRPPRAESARTEHRGEVSRPEISRPRRRDEEKRPSFPRRNSEEKKNSAWKPRPAVRDKVLPLFPGMDAFARRGLQLLPRILDGVMPLTAARRRELPAACRELSALLTTDRADLSLPYWSTPRLTSAFLRYFLPWNLIRLLPLLPSLPLSLPDFSEKKPRALVIDLGSGPLTLPLALWLGRPDFRAAPLTVLCIDSALHPLHLGRDIFNALRRELDPSSPWDIRLLRAPFGQSMRRLKERPWLISAGNVLNEMEEKSRKPGAWQERLESFAAEAARALLPGGFLFALEPGTRQGAKLIRSLRALSLDEERAFLYDQDDMEDDAPEERETFTAPDAASPDHADCPDEEDDSPLLIPLSPCPHREGCPLDRPGCSAWCHVNAPASDVPEELKTLSRSAGMDKESVSLSFLLLHKPDRPVPPVAPSRTEPLNARLLSEPFVLPGYPGRARYACTSRGLALVPDCSRLPPGALCEVENIPSPQRDRKSGALILPLFRKNAVPPRPGEQSGRKDRAFSRPVRQKNSDDAPARTGPRQDRASDLPQQKSRKKFPDRREGGAKRQA